jgi:hypothetical protein
MSLNTGKKEITAVTRTEYTRTTDKRTIETQKVEMNTIKTKKADTNILNKRTTSASNTTLS